ncbi:DMT family transporter [Marinobacterium lutimaris]|uniref:Small multidrug resistance pump n=1 Tax=Marinobacterium lutimaris TaxID=568106 RepID=A0A1H6B5L8_9GAMM|nr:SMR family transporter [Marinobacterium lutimaris]SEG55920.1 small multidrug resistance pump [Marinobacterium lutimaris]
MNPWFLLAVAIVSEVIGTSALKASESFTRPIPSAIAIVGYVLAAYLLALTLKTIPVGIAYAIWAGMGVVLVALASWLLYDQRLDMPAVAGMCLVVAGVAVINLFSKTAMH